MLSAVYKETSDEPVHDEQPSPDAFSQRRVSHPQALTTAALLLVIYIAGSSVLGLGVGLLFECRSVLLSAWSNVGADVVFIIGSIAGAVGGVTVAKRSVGRSIAIAALITWATYTIAGALAGPICPSVDFSGLSGTGTGSGVSSAPSVGVSIASDLLGALLLGLPGLVFAALSPAIARRALGRFFLRGR